MDEYTNFVRGVQIAAVLLVLGWSAQGFARVKKTRVALGITMLAGYRDSRWEAGNDLSFQIDSRNLNLRLRAPMYYTMSRHTRLDPLDWDQPSDYGRILDVLRVHTNDNSLVLYAGPLRRVTMGIGELVQGYYNALSHRSAKAGLRLSGDAGFVGTDVVVADVVRPQDLVMADVFLRPLHSTGNVLRRLRIEAQFALAGLTGGMYIRYGLGLHVPVYANKVFSTGLQGFFRKDIYTIAWFSRWHTRHTSGHVQAGLRISRLKVNTPWINLFFELDRHCFLCKGDKHDVLNTGKYQRNKVGVAAGFLRFDMRVRHLLNIWTLVDFDTVDTALYAAGMGLTIGKIRAGASVAINGRHRFIYSAELRWMFYGPVFLEAQGSQSCDYTHGRLERVNVAMAGVGAMLMW